MNAIPLSHLADSSAELVPAKHFGTVAETQAYLKSQGVALAEVAGCVACTDSSMCDGTAAQSSCRSLTAGPSQSATCSAGCIAGIVAGATFVVCTAVFVVVRNFLNGKKSVAPEP